MVGDATRTPIIATLCTQIFNKTEVCRTLYSTEVLGRGSCLQSAMLSPLFQVA